MTKYQLPSLLCPVPTLTITWWQWPHSGRHFPHVLAGAPWSWTGLECDSLSPVKDCFSPVNLYHVIFLLFSDLALAGEMSQPCQPKVREGSILASVLIQDSRILGLRVLACCASSTGSLAAPQATGFCDLETCVSQAVQHDGGTPLV